MQISEEQYNRVQAWLDGSMPEEEQRLFKDEMTADPALSEYVNFEMAVRNDLKNIAEKKEIFSLFQEADQDSSATAPNAAVQELIRQAAEAWHKNNQTSIANEETPIITQKARVVSMRIRAIAAAAVVLIAVAGAYFLSRPGGGGIAQNPNAFNDSMYALNFSKDPAPQNPHPMLAEALSDYTNSRYNTLQQYDLANLPILKGVHDERQQVLETGYFYKGIAFMETNDLSKADSSFQWVLINSHAKILLQKSNWYTALIRLKQDRPKEALPLLKKVYADSTDQSYRNKAEILLKQLQQAQIK